MFLSFLTRGHVLYWQRTLLNSKIFIFYESSWIRFDVVETYEFGSYRETTYCVLSMFFPIGIIRRSAWLRCSYHRRLELFSVFSVVSLLCRGTWLLSSWWTNMGFRQPLFILTRYSRGTLWYDLLQRSIIAVSAAVAPVATHWESRFIAALDGGLSIIHDSHKATTDCLGDIGPVRACHASWIESSTSNRTPLRGGVHSPGYYPYPELL